MVDSTVALSVLAIIATCTAALIWIVKFLMTEMRKSLDANAKAHLKVAKATDSNTLVSKETLNFLKALNGKVAKATIQTVKEQRVEQQIVNNRMKL